MLEVPVYNPSGERIDTLAVDEAAFGGKPNAPLLKQAMVAYQASARQGSAATRSRGMVHGSTRKLYRQKGTGFARRGASRTVVMRGGGVAFAKRPGNAAKRLPRKMRKAALRSAILAKILGGDLAVVDGLTIETPRTRVIAEMLTAIGIDRSCVLATADRDRAVYLSGRNIPDLTIRTVQELNAYEVAARRKMLVTLEAMRSLTGEEAAR